MAPAGEGGAADGQRLAQLLSGAPGGGCHGSRLLPGHGSSTGYPRRQERRPLLDRRPSELPQLPAHLEGIPRMVLIHQQDGQGGQHQGEHRQSWPG
jgi:hypothetical protein